MENLSVCLLYVFSLCMLELPAEWLSRWHSRQRIVFSCCPIPLLMSLFPEDFPPRTTDHLLFSHSWEGWANPYVNHKTAIHSVWGDAKRHLNLFSSPKLICPQMCPFCGYLLSWCKLQMSTAVPSFCTQVCFQSWSVKRLKTLPFMAEWKFEPSYPWS